MAREPIGRRQAVAVAAVVAVLCLGGCAALWGPRTVDVSVAQLQRAIDGQLPASRTVWGPIEVRLATAQLSLWPDEQRLSVRLVLELADRLSGHIERVALTLRHGVRFEPADHTVRLTRTRIDAFELDGVERALDHPLARWVVPAVEQLLDDRIVYTVSAQDLQALQGRGWRPGELRVAASGLRLTLLPATSES